ncbi:MAG: hypothetical protein V4561_02475 [Bacteroidota bacterium]
MKKIIGLLSCFFFFIGHIDAQEKLFLKNQREPINCQVTEINSTEIKYKPSDAEQLVIGVSVLEVEKIVFKSGRVQYFTDPLSDYDFYKGQKRWIIKAGILSPAVGFTDFYLEKSIKPGRSVEYQLNVIGLGKNLTINNAYSSSNQEIKLDQKGASIGVGLKVLRLPDFELTNRKLMHILQGGYLKPAVMLGYYQRNMVYTDPLTYATKIQTKGIMTSFVSVTVGKQWILDNTFSIDLYALMGMGVDNFRSQQTKINKDAGNNPYVSLDNIPYQNFGYTRFGRGDVGIGIGGGLKLGYLFNTKKKKDASVGKMRERLNK